MARVSGEDWVPWEASGRLLPETDTDRRTREQRDRRPERLKATLSSSRVRRASTGPVAGTCKWQESLDPGCGEWSREGAAESGFKPQTPEFTYRAIPALPEIRFRVSRELREGRGLERESGEWGPDV